MGKMAITLGADPEFELIIDRRIISACNILGEDIHLPWGDIGKDGAGHPLELRPEPSASARGLVANVGRLLVATPKVIGGYPSTQCEVHAIGGHVHIGFGDGPKPDYSDIAKGIDNALGDIFYSLSAPTRIKAGYGKRGDWRSQRWGIEYRTPPASIWAHPQVALTFVGATKWIVRELLGGGNPLKSPALPRIRAAAKSAADFTKRYQGRLHWGAWQAFVGAVDIARHLEIKVSFDSREHDPELIEDIRAMCARLRIASLRVISLRKGRGYDASNVPGYGALVEDFATFAPGKALCLSWLFRNDPEFRRAELPKLEEALAALLNPSPDDGGRLIKEALPLKLSSAAEELEALEPEPEPEPEALEPEPEAEAEDIHYCDRCGEGVHREDAIVTNGGEGPYCDDCYHELYTRCSHCDREIAREDAWRGANGEVYCERCYRRTYRECANCECEIWREDAIFIDGEAYCRDCAGAYVEA